MDVHLFSCDKVDLSEYSISETKLKLTYCDGKMLTSFRFCFFLSAMKLQDMNNFLSVFFSATKLLLLAVNLIPIKESAVSTLSLSLQKKILNKKVSIHNKNQSVDISEWISAPKVSF